MTELTQNKEYKNWLIEIKSKIKSSQIKAAISVNSELIMLYWYLGMEIADRQITAKWGSGLIKQLSDDLKAEFPGIGGFSEYNLRMCRKFYLFYNQVINKKWEQVVPVPKDKSLKWEQLVPIIPWGHHILILKKIKTVKEALFYISETIENNWTIKKLKNYNANIFTNPEYINIF